MVRVLQLVMVVLLCAQAAQGQMRIREGVVSVNKLPDPIISQSVVRLNVPHIRQAAYLCVPTSAAMILGYFGQNVAPAGLKKLADSFRPVHDRHPRLTYWADMQKALHAMGQHWQVKTFSVDNVGFEQGMEFMRKTLRAGTPFMMDMHIDEGHTFVVKGFDDRKRVLYISDPGLSSRRARAVSYDMVRKHWHSLYSPHRYILVPNKV